jgi:hypothetical protein
LPFHPPPRHPLRRELYLPLRSAASFGLAPLHIHRRLAFDQPGGLSFGVRGFLVFDAPSSVIFFGNMVVEGKRRSYCGEWR